MFWNINRPFCQRGFCLPQLFAEAIHLDFVVCLVNAQKKGPLGDKRSRFALGCFLYDASVHLDRQLDFPIGNDKPIRGQFQPARMPHHPCRLDHWQRLLGEPLGERVY
ncbi:MAG: hypothetical protein KatS3mg112_1059 [Thermogutta sp.]|nr:MAG: hypothetical protein KatS3mg112_1059 [Thermogutta sp.]